LSINKSKDKSRPIRNIEKWSDIIAKLNLDVSKPVNYITADQIKQTSNREPRLMAKMDKTEDLPKVFRDNNLFVLPISRREYAIVKGVGYHQSEPITEKPIIHNTQIAFPVSALDRKSESIYLEYASSSGLLKKLSGEDNLIPILRGRTTTPIFSFNVNDTKLTVNKAQIEIDAGFESPTQMLLFEAKINLPSSFNIRQLYYPYRTFSAALGQKVKKKVRNFFFCFRPKLNLYLFWEYEFNPSDNFESINLIQCKQYQVKVYKVPSIKQFRNVPVRKGIDIPQADDVNKIIQFPVKVFEGYDSAKKMRGIFGLVARQITYYGQASETLGLVKRHRDKYEVTDIAEIPETTCRKKI
jgi:hypothetical protein